MFDPLVGADPAFDWLAFGLSATMIACLSLLVLPAVADQKPRWSKALPTSRQLLVLLLLILGVSLLGYAFSGSPPMNPSYLP